MGHDDPQHGGPGHAHGDHRHEHDELIGAPADAPRTSWRDSVAVPQGEVVRDRLAHGVGVGKILHFDCFSGIAGDMIVGALLDLGTPREAFERALEALPLGGYTAGSHDKAVSSIAATKFEVTVTAGQPSRTHRDIRAMLEQSTLPGGIKRRAIETFHVLAVAEGKIHRIAADDVHFHEVGAVDSIVDIVGACAGFEWLGARITCAPLPMGRGLAQTEHGIIPLPAPAVVEVLRGVPTEGAPLDVEMVTPTGAALMRANASEFTRWPAMSPVATGFGAGTRTLDDRPNLLRVVLGEPLAEGALGAGPHRPSDFAVLEANLDDASGEIMATVTEALMFHGALDAWTSPIGMKKGRPGFMVSALTRHGDTARLARIMMSECPTLGVRIRPSDRLERPRRVLCVQTTYGAVDVKVSDGDGLPVTAKPEHDVVQRIAREHGVPAQLVHAAALAAFWATQGT